MRSRSFGDFIKANPALPPIHQKLFENIYKRCIAPPRAFLDSDNHKFVSSERAADLLKHVRRNALEKLRAYLKQRIDIVNKQLFRRSSTTRREFTSAS
jgi:hypothetical protein